MKNEQLAFQAISHYLKTGQALAVKPKKPLAACFVTLYLNKKLKGCIGTAEAFESLEKNIVRNALAAATQDWRFPPVTLADFPKLKIEVSVLTPPKPYQPNSLAGLLAYLQKNRPGLIISQSGHQALFLPQVWKELPKPKDFLTRLCLKAGLAPTAWQDKTIKFSTFDIQT